MFENLRFVGAFASDCQLRERRLMYPIYFKPNDSRLVQFYVDFECAFIGSPCSAQYCNIQCFRCLPQKAAERIKRRPSQPHPSRGPVAKLVVFFIFIILIIIQDLISHLTDDCILHIGKFLHRCDTFTFDNQNYCRINIIELFFKEKKLID